MDALHQVAANAVRRAVRRGDLIRPTHCSRCEEQKKSIVAHHHNGYDEEHWLDVEWLCRACHSIVHCLSVGLGLQTSEELAARLRTSMDHDALSAAGRAGGTAAGVAMRQRYSPEELSAIKRRGALKTNAIRWGKKDT